MTPADMARMTGETPQEMAAALRAVADDKDSTTDLAAHIVSEAYRKLADDLDPPAVSS